MTAGGATPSFQGLRVLSLESRRATEMAALISTYGGRPLVAPALREVPLASNSEALDFADALMRGELDIVIFLTGVGTRALVTVAERRYPRDLLAAALGRTKVVVRGPKPLAAVRELQVPVWVTVPEPNTWRELLAAIDAKSEEQPLGGARIAVQEYGVSNTELLDALAKRGATVTRVPVYRWALPEDLEPLKNALRSIAGGEVDVVMFTTGVQVVHLWRIAGEMQIEADVRRELARMMVASIGPSTSEELRRHGLSADLEPSHPKIGFLVREAAEKAAAVLRTKRTP
jgi:uroporphyrinogen-III synthase